LSSQLSSQTVRMKSPSNSTTCDLSSLSSLSSQPDEWPTIREEAFHGLARRLVEAIAPHSEADRVALLAQLLGYFGVVVGRSPSFRVGVTAHTTNLFLCLVGATSRARKGSSFDFTDWLFHHADPFWRVDPTWSDDNLGGGCGSGEGLIAAVRDPTW